MEAYISPLETTVKFCCHTGYTLKHLVCKNCTAPLLEQKFDTSGFDIATPRNCVHMIPMYGKIIKQSGEAGVSHVPKKLDRCTRRVFAWWFGQLTGACVRRPAIGVPQTFNILSVGTPIKYATQNVLVQFHRSFLHSVSAEILEVRYHYSTGPCVEPA